MAVWWLGFSPIHAAPGRCKGPRARAHMHNIHPEYRGKRLGDGAHSASVSSCWWVGGSIEERTDTVPPAGRWRNAYAREEARASCEIVCVYSCEVERSLGA